MIRMEQIAFDFEARRLARRTDPDRSHRAARKAVTFKDDHKLLIVRVLKLGGAMTPRQIAHATSLDYHAVQRRAAELERVGLITRGPDELDGLPLWRAV